MSTDTAFALGLLALVGPRFPDRLRAFMLTVVVVDDILALVVIATVCTETVSVSALLVAVGLFGAVLVAKALRVRVGLVYFALGAGSGCTARIRGRAGGGRACDRPLAYATGRALRARTSNRALPRIP